MEKYMHTKGPNNNSKVSTNLPYVLAIRPSPVANWSQYRYCDWYTANSSTMCQRPWVEQSTDVMAFRSCAENELPPRCSASSTAAELMAQLLPLSSFDTFTIKLRSTESPAELRQGS